MLLIVHLIFGEIQQHKHVWHALQAVLYALKVNVFNALADIYQVVYVLVCVLLLHMLLILHVYYVIIHVILVMVLTNLIVYHAIVDIIYQMGFHLNVL